MEHKDLADRLEQEADEITCYASTIKEHRPNGTAKLLREAAKALRGAVSEEELKPVTKAQWDHLERYFSEKLSRPSAWRDGLLPETKE